MIITNYLATDSQRAKDYEFVLEYVDTDGLQDFPLKGTLEQAVELGLLGIELDVLDPITLEIVVTIREEPCPPTLRSARGHHGDHHD